jgi:hypothetical protein
VATAPTEVCPPEVRFDGFFEEGTVCMIVTGRVIGELTVRAKRRV